jgi:hypothetical protein
MLLSKRPSRPVAGHGFKVQFTTLRDYSQGRRVCDLLTSCPSTSDQEWGIMYFQICNTTQHNYLTFVWIRTTSLNASLNVHIQIQLFYSALILQSSPWLPLTQQFFISTLQLVLKILFHSFVVALCIPKPLLQLTPSLRHTPKEAKEGVETHPKSCRKRPVKEL